MLDVLYTLIIFPLIQILEVVYVFARRISGNPAIAVIGVSIAVSVCTLPLYFMAEKHQKIERDIQRRLKAKADKIKAAFKGDERYMMLSAWYRQNHYHPVYALRGSLGLLIQIPFFIAAYSFLSHLEELKGVSFLFLRDLGAPDAFFTVKNVGGGGAVGDFRINILPILMTLINCVSCFMYSKTFPVKEKVQLYGMALIFLALLYNSPSGLVLYWTMNNIFSLAKNILQKVKNLGRIVFCLSCGCVVLLDVFLLFFRSGNLYKRIVIAAICACIFLLPAAAKLIGLIKQKIKNRTVLNDTALALPFTFIVSLLIIGALAGLVIPSALIASSAQEFSFIENFTSPFPFIIKTVLQSAGFFIVWPLCIYYLFSANVKKKLTLLFSMLCIVALVDVFIFPGNYGFLTASLVFSNSVADSLMANAVNIVVIALAVIIFAALLFSPKKIFFQSAQIILLISVSIIGAINLATISREYFNFASQREKTEFAAIKKPDAVYQFSKTEKNVLIIMLDRAISAYVPYIFEENPELQESFSGFTWYPNCISFGGHTLQGSPGLFGGYEYAPLKMQERIDKTLKEKHNEALLVLPELFCDNGFSVTVTDPAWANYSWVPDLTIFKAYPQIDARNINATGIYTAYWLQSHPDIKIISLAQLLKHNFIQFSFFKILPPVLRPLIYNNGNYLTARSDAAQSISANTINQYAALDILPDITAINADSPPSFIVLDSELTHETAFLQAPDYVPATEVTNRGSGPFADEDHYHVNSAAYLLFGKWFSFLKQNDVYDNTRIIIVSDHGQNMHSDFPGNIVLPNGEWVQTYNALLMVKDFNAKGELSANHAFMTNADVPILATKDLIENPANPFTHIPFASEKENGVTITTSQNWDPGHNKKYTFAINKNEWLHVKDDIFKRENWTQEDR